MLASPHAFVMRAVSANPRPALGKTEPSRAVSSRNTTMQNARITLEKHAKRNFKFQTHKTKLLK
jgi:hypothetical protein